MSQPQPHSALVYAIPQLEDSTSHHIVAQCESSPVHRVLSHEPLLGLILRFALNTEGRGGRASVAAFALTCQDMYNVAVRVLWERMDNICPLAMTARRGVIWECTKVQGPLAEWTARLSDPSRGLAPLDLTSLMRHAEYIKELVLRHCFDGVVSITEHPTLFLLPKRSTCGPAPLLPCLRILKAYAGHQQLHLKIFAAPTLQRLDIKATLYDKLDQLIPVLEEILLHCPELERLAITESDRPDGERLCDNAPVRKAFKHFLTELPHSPPGARFRCLKTEVPIHWEDILILAQLPNLETLNALADFDDFDKSPTRSDLPEGSFARLSHLQLRLWSFDEALLRILKNVHSPVLESLDVTAWLHEFVPTRDLAYRFFQLASQERFRHTLRRFRLWIDCDGPFTHGIREAGQVLYDMATIEPLRDVRSLERVCISVPAFRYGSVTTATLVSFRELARAWRSIRKLEIYSNYTRKSHIDLRVLWAFAFSPVLEELGFNRISWDSTRSLANLNRLKVNGEWAPRSGSLKRLCFRRCIGTEEEKELIREYAWELFPNVNIGDARY